MAARRRSPLGPLLGLAVLVVLVVLLVKGVMGLLGGSSPIQVPVSEQCVVTVGTVSDSRDLAAAQNAAIIVAESIRRGLPPRAASIALATAMQESKLHNLTYGDLDSVGLFQQRPSQGWGTRAEILDPWYSSGKFYDALVKVSGWQTADLNDVAQAVQHSGVPDGYRAHVAAAKAWASALTGNSPAAVSCVNRSTATPDTSAARQLLTKAYGSAVKVTPGQSMVTLDSSSSVRLWGATQLFMVASSTSGYTHITVGNRTWTKDDNQVATWQGSDTSNATESVITLRA